MPRIILSWHATSRRFVISRASAGALGRKASTASTFRDICPTNGSSLADMITAQTQAKLQTATAAIQEMLKVSDE